MGEGVVDAAADLGLVGRVGGKQDAQADDVTRSFGGGVVGGQRTRRFVLPVPADGHRNGRPRSADVIVGLHGHDRIVSKDLSHRGKIHVSR